MDMIGSLDGLVQVNAYVVRSCNYRTFFYAHKPLSLKIGQSPLVLRG